MRKTIFILLLAVTLCGMSFGHDGGKLGLLFKGGSQNSVGVSLAVSPRMNIRTTAGFEMSTSDHTDEELERNNFNVGFGIFVDVLKRKEWAVYTGVEVAYHHQNQEMYMANYVGGTYESVFYEREDDGISGDLVLGVRHKIGKRLALYGEINLGYRKYESDFAAEGISSSDSMEQSSFGLSRSGFGLIFYL